MTRSRFFAALPLLLLASLPTAARTVDAAIAPQDVIVHFVGPRAFAAACPPDSRACAVDVPKPCQVWLRAGSRLWGDPATERAGFLDPMTATELAHELLHCAVGRWHPG